MTKIVQLKDRVTGEVEYPVTIPSAIKGFTDGNEGQVLTKTEEGVEWGDIPTTDLGNYVTHEELENELYETSDYETVDLGLPSGLLWATCNIGATKPEESGLYFQWGDTKGYKGACSEAESTEDNKETHYFDIDKYKFGPSSDGTKYNYVDNKIVLDPEDDAATTNMGSDWRIPSPEEFQELLDNTEGDVDSNEFGVVENYNETGITVLLRKSKINGNVILFPFTGKCTSWELVNNGVYCWTNSVYQMIYPGYTTQGAYCYTGWATNPTARYDGLPIRAVTTVSKTTKYLPRTEYQSLNKQDIQEVLNVLN